MANPKAFTLMEMIVVMVLIGILAVMGWLNYNSSIENALDKEAKSTLKLIVAGEKIYRLENDTGSYVNTGNTTDTNTKLRLTISSSKWSYRVTSATTTNFNATATRIGGNGRSWSTTSTIPSGW